MHERERHRIILSAVQEKPVATVQDLVELTSASEATIRRDIAALHVQGRLRRVRGGAEALHPAQIGSLAAKPFRVSESENIAKKRAIAREAVALCDRGRCDHHQRRHDHLPDGALPDDPPAAGVHEFLRDRRASREAFQEPGDAAGRLDLPRPEHHSLAVRERRDAQLLCPPHVHGRARRRRARRHGAGCPDHPGRAEADQSGRRAGADGRFQQVPAPLEPHPVPARPGLYADYRRRHPGFGPNDDRECGNQTDHRRRIGRGSGERNPRRRPESRQEVL